MNTFIFFEAQEHAKDTNKAKKKNKLYASHGVCVNKIKTPSSVKTFSTSVVECWAPRLK